MISFSQRNVFAWPFASLSKGSKLCTICDNLTGRLFPGSFYIFQQFWAVSNRNCHRPQTNRTLGGSGSETISRQKQRQQILVTKILSLIHFGSETILDRNRDNKFWWQKLCLWYILALRHFGSETFLDRNRDNKKTLAFVALIILTSRFDDQDYNQGWGGQGAGMLIDNTDKAGAREACMCMCDHRPFVFSLYFHLKILCSFLNSSPSPSPSPSMWLKRWVGAFLWSRYFQHGRTIYLNLLVTNHNTLLSFIKGSTLVYSILLEEAKNVNIETLQTYLSPACFHSLVF